MANQRTWQAVARGREPGTDNTEAQPHEYQYSYQRRTESKNGNGNKLAKALGWFSLGLGLAEIIAPRGLTKLMGLKEDHSILLRLLGLREVTSGIGILTNRRPAAWMWSRVAGDAIDISLLGTALATEDRARSRVIAATAAVAGVTALDVLCAQRLSRDKSDRAIRVEAVTINRPLEEVYRFWRNFQNLPHFMAHLESVQVTDERRSHWVARAPAGTTVEWDAEIIEDRPNELIAWRSLEGADVDNSGVVRFSRAPGGRGTEVRVEMEYNPPGGIAGVGIAKLFGEEPGQQIKSDLRRLKQVIETGEVVHSDASIHRGMHPARPPADGEE